MIVEQSREQAVRNQMLGIHPTTAANHQLSRVKVSFVNIAGETELILHAPPDIRYPHLIDFAEDLLGLYVHRDTEPDPSLPHLQVLTPEGAVIHNDVVYKAWLLGSKHPGSAVPKWMWTEEMNRRQQYHETPTSSTSLW